MTKPGFTAIALVVDRSGSMAGIANTTTDAINEYISGLTGDTWVTLSQFDDRYEIVFPLTKIGDLPTFHLEARGATALWDAIGRTVTDLGRELEKMPEDERPSTVIVGIMTDGYENSSRDYDRGKLRDLIQQQQDKYGWQFLFMGANQDAVMTGAEIGLAAHSSISYNTSRGGTKSVMGTMNSYTASAMSGSRYVITEEDREGAMDE